ncbi:MAG: hypothetical protein IKS07_09085 [Lachnospiraceae bacterium]|nr:hypothetical protein [Lachnospiraceae bacterium]MCR5477395.1 hypothetical protein [Lachnospiraceae bacterium]
MWEESIRLELLALGVGRVMKARGGPDEKKEFQDLYRDLRIEFPTLSEREIWEIIGLCVKVYENRFGTSG